MTPYKKKDEDATPSVEEVKEAPAPEPQPVEEKAAALETLVAAQGQQIAELMAALGRSQDASQKAHDPTQSPFERERRAEHVRLKNRKKRTPEGDADPNLCWCGTRYQVRPVPRGYVPVEFATTAPAQPATVPDQPEGASPGRTALPGGLVVPGNVLSAGG